MGSLRKCKSVIIDDEEKTKKERLIVTKREKIGVVQENEKVVIEIGEEEQIEIVIVIKRKEIDEEEIDKKEIISAKRKDFDEEDQIDNDRVISIKRKEKEIAIVVKRKEIYGEEQLQRVMVERINEIDGEEQKERTVISKKRKEIDEEDRINKETVIVEKRKKIDEEEENEKERRAIVKEIDKERLLGDKRRENDYEEQNDREIAVGKQIEDYSPPCKILPEDLIMNSILTRLPARTLAVCSCVSKLWYKTIYSDTRFASSHFVQNQNKLSLGFSFINTKLDDAMKAYFYSFDDEDDPEDDGNIYITLDTALTLEDINELVGYCNGLICIKLFSEANEEKGIVSVISRTRCEILSFSYLTPTVTGELCKYLCHGFGFDSVSQVFKVVLVFTSPTNEEFICLVFTLGTNSWRTITTAAAEISMPPGCFASPVSRLVTSITRIPCRQATFCGDGLFWKTTNEVGNDSVIEMLLSFDLHNEKIQFIRVPTECTLPVMMNWHEYLVVDHLLEFKGYPCIARSEKIEIGNSDHSGHRCNERSSFCCCCCKVHLYILKDKVKQIWIKEETLDVQIKDPEGLLPGPICCHFGIPTATTVPPPTQILTFYDQVLLYWFDGECLLIYNLHKKHLKVVRCSYSYPDLFRTKLNKLPGHCIGDNDIVDMDYQLHAQVENIVSLETFIPEGETCKFSCFEDLRQITRKKQLAGWVNPGIGSAKIYTSFSLFSS